MTKRDQVDGAAKDHIALPGPAHTGRLSLEETLARRRSVRSFAPDGLGLATIGQLAWSAQGVTDTATGYRTAPTAGGTLPVEVDLVVHGTSELEDGVYRYLPRAHALRRRLAGDRRQAVADATLNQGFVGEAPVVMVLSAVAARTTPTFGAFTDRLIDMEIGHVGENVSLQAVALGLGTVVVAGIRADDLAEALALADGERPIYVLPVGRPR